MSSSAHRGGPNRLILALTLLGSIQFIGAALAVTLGFRKAETAIVLGLSPARLSLAILALVIAVVILAAGLLALRRNVILPDLRQAASGREPSWLSVVGILIAAMGWTSIFSPAYVFGEWGDYFSRLRPLLIASSLFAIEIWMALALSRRTGTLRSWFQNLGIPNLLGFALALLCLLAGWLLMLASKFGIEKAGPFWNPPGMPIAGLQGLAVVVLICLGIVAARATSHNTAPTKGRISRWLLPAAVYLCAVLVWGITPMQRHYFALRPAPPSYEPFPFSDARNYDLGALSIITGQGIFFHDYTDKPLYIVFLAFLHLLGGDNYVLLTWLQVAVLACIPVMLFVLGRRFHSEVLGVAVALLTILQQANSIQASREIDSVNPKLLMTEVPTLLCMTVVAYLLFRWFRTLRPEYALTSGAAIGAASVVRANPLMLVPVAGALAIIALRRQRPLLYRHILLFLAGFALIFSPWLVTGVNEAGAPWMWIKIQYIISQRFQSMLVPPTLYPVAQETISRTPVSAPVGAVDHVAYAAAGGTPYQVSLTTTGSHAVKSIGSSRASGSEAPLIPRVLSHSLHNAAAALLSLPNLLTLDNLDQLSQSAPWGSSTWRGYLTAAQHLATLANLVLLAVGMAWSWHRFRLAGLVPAFVFVGYDLSLALATTSGGRYIVPVNWVAHFYYALGWVVILAAVVGARLDTSVGNSMPAQMGGAGSTRLITSSITVFLVAMLIPVANVVMPMFVQSRIVSEARSQLSGVSANTEEGVQLVYGKVLYPYYHSDSRSVSFHLLTDSGYWPNLVVAKKSVFPYTSLQSGSLGLAGVSGEKQGRVVRFLYVTPKK